MSKLWKLAIKFSNKFLKYLGLTWIIHLYLWAVLTPWFFWYLQYSNNQYITWIWQAPIMALLTNYPLGKMCEWFIPRWDALIDRNVK